MITIVGNGSSYKTELFNFRFKDGKESFSFIVPIIEERVIHSALRGGVFRDPQRGLLHWALVKCNRYCDRDRARIAIRTRDGRIEVRLEFDPPWWWSQVNGQRAENTDPASP